jgi:hypothetical protein
VDRTTIIEKIGDTLDFSKLTNDERAIVAGAEFEVFMEKDGEDVHPVKKIKLKFADMNDACDKLMKKFNQYKEHEKSAGEGVVDSLRQLLLEINGSRILPGTISRD